MVSLDQCENNSLVISYDVILDEQYVVREYFTRGRHKNIYGIEPSSSNETPLHHPSSNETPLHHPSSNETPLHHSSSYETPLHHPISNETSLHHPISNETSLHHPSSNETPLHHPISNETSLHHPSSNETPLHQPSSNETPLHHLSSNETPLHHPSSNETPLHHPSSNETPLHHPASNETPLHHLSSNETLGETSVVSQYSNLSRAHLQLALHICSWHSSLPGCNRDFALEGAQRPLPPLIQHAHQDSQSIENIQHIRLYSPCGREEQEAGLCLRCQPMTVRPLLETSQTMLRATSIARTTDQHDAVKSLPIREFGV
ncbi:hypothetical protein PR048_030987 [Dryococelus australis]|uniref:Uncharacterized protein n=1 Tax=Dryococelus australis TaxID=614101 RepID=A0ABQ9G6Y2_9NEOP|nr:hypothetical protein PR048_030987 [Dryococelus australis]